MQFETLEIISVGETCTLWASPSSPPPLDINQDEGCVEGPRLIPPVLLPLSLLCSVCISYVCQDGGRPRTTDGRTDGRAGDTGERGRQGGSAEESRDRSPPTELLLLPHPVAELLRGEVFRRRERPNKRNSAQHSFLTLGVGILPSLHLSDPSCSSHTPKLYAA